MSDRHRPERGLRYEPGPHHESKARSKLINDPVLEDAKPPWSMTKLEQMDDAFRKAMQRAVQRTTPQRR
jgi:hypothetical protein